MDIDTQSFQTVLIEISSLNLTINGDFAARIAPLLREEYPERMVPEARYGTREGGSVCCLLYNGTN